MKKAALYCRVSAADQHIESQLYDLRQLAAQRGFQVVKEYEDRGVSGLKAGRAGLPLRNVADTSGTQALDQQGKRLPPHERSEGKSCARSSESFR